MYRTHTHTSIYRYSLYYYNSRCTGRVLLHYYIIIVYNNYYYGK